jgi:large subunit ribosomal protein L9
MEREASNQMKVLLLEEVINLGQAGRVVTVADGYARNYLIPRGLAKVATEGALREAEQIRKAGERKRVRLVADAQSLAQRINEIALTFQARAGETGKLYGSITTADLAEGLERELGQEIDRRKIISDPLRQVGDHEVEIRLFTDVSATLRVTIEAEGGDEEEGKVPVAVAETESEEEA